MSVEIAWKQNILVTDFHLLKSVLVVFGFGSQAFVCGFSRQNINSVNGATLFFLPNFPGAMFIQGATFIPDSIVVTVKTIRRVEHIFVAFSEKLNFSMKQE